MLTWIYNFVYNSKTVLEDIIQSFLNIEGFLAALYVYVKSYSVTLINTKFLLIFMQDGLK